MKKLFSAITTLLLVALCSNLAFAQTKYDPAKYRSEPIWIQMMEDPEANFFETVNAFRTFWKGYELPGEPEEMESNGGFKREVGLKGPGVEEESEHKKEKRKDPGYGDYSFEVKQFKGWLRNVQAWVQEDGHILTAEERQQILDKQNQELKTIEKNQKN